MVAPGVLMVMLAEGDPGAASEQHDGVQFHAALEGLAESFPSGTPVGAQDLFAIATPLMSIDAGDEFAFELGANLRLRVFDDPPLQRAGDIAGVLRGADWREPSDFGQILRELRIGGDDWPMYLRAGPL